MRGSSTRLYLREELDHTVGELARELATQTSPAAITRTKQLLADLRGLGLRKALEHAIEVNVAARGTEDCQAGVAAFLQKKPPPWRISG